jgi:hypothetical protein
VPASLTKRNGNRSSVSTAAILSAVVATCASRPVETVCTGLSPLFQSQKHCRKRASFADESLLVDSPLRPKLNYSMLIVLGQIRNVIRYTFYTATRHNNAGNRTKRLLILQL